MVGYLAWRAGLLDAPRQAAPRELAAAFSFGKLPRTAVRLPADIADGTFWWEKEVTPPDGPKRTIESGPLVVLLDSAVDGGS